MNYKKLLFLLLITGCNNQPIINTPIPNQAKMPSHFMFVETQYMPLNVDYYIPGNAISVDPDLNMWVNKWHWLSPKKTTNSIGTIRKENDKYFIQLDDHNYSWKALPLKNNVYYLPISKKE